MGLQQKIQSELKDAMKAKDTAKTGAIRIVLGEFARQPSKELNDEQVVGILKKLIKSERELLAVSKGTDTSFIDILETYLPQQATEDDIRNWIKENVDLSEFKNAMQAMRPIMTHFGPSADGNLVKKVLQELS